MNFKNFATALAALGAEEKREERIIGGHESTGGRYSYAVSLADRLGSFCGGSLIAPDIVLTAAHCAGGDYFAIVGRHDLDTAEGDEIQIKKEIIHPWYEPFTTNNDFMVLVLVSSTLYLGDFHFMFDIILALITFLLQERPTSAKVSMVQLNDDKSVPEVGGECVVIGWGDTTQDDYTVEISSVLREVSVNVLSNKVCAKSEGEHNGWEDSYRGLITRNMLCAKG